MVVGAETFAPVAGGRQVVGAATDRPHGHDADTGTAYAGGSMSAVPEPGAGGDGPAGAAVLAPGGVGCACVGAACEPWCTCASCDGREATVCMVEVGMTFHGMLCEMLDTLSDDKCGERVLTKTHRDASGTLRFAFEDAPAPAAGAAGSRGERRCRPAPERHTAAPAGTTTGYAAAGR